MTDEELYLQLKNVCSQLREYVDGYLQIEIGKTIVYVILSTSTLDL